MDIYIDVLVIVNCYITWLTLSATAFIAHIYINTKFKLLACMLGGLSSLIILLPSEKPLQILTLNLLKVLGLIAVLLSAFIKQNIKKAVISSVIFIGISVMLAGAVYFTETLVGNGVFYTNNGVLYIDISLTQLIVVTAFIYILLAVISHMYSRYADKNHSYKVDFAVHGRSYSLRAIADTGNSAKDIFTGKPVIICTGINLYTGCASLHLIPIPYNTISGEGVLYACKPDYVYIINEKNEKHSVDVLIAGIDSGNDTRAIFNPSIL
ncbi:MAG: sigma-E processing peptidase SpoIIGA [Oscillospiraceae bacterium]|nr:sigma-E processing peptidase SpoIIGA [Oscillospiraceae bacterium]